MGEIEKNLSKAENFALLLSNGGILKPRLTAGGAYWRAVMRTGSIIAMIGAVLSIATSSLARADDLGWFSGISARPLIKDVDVAGFNSRVDRSDLGQRVYSAYRINKSLGLELGYADSPKIDGGGSTMAPPGPFSGAVKARGWQLSGVGTLPLGENHGTFNSSVPWVSPL